MPATYDPQLLKGVLTLLLLRLLADRESYGYEVVQRLREVGLSEISEGTVYPALARLEREGRITARLVSSSAGPARKYYQPTPDGLLGPHGRNRQLAIPGQPGQCRLDSPNALHTH